MKKTYTILFLLLSTVLSIYSQNCQRPVSADFYRQKYMQLTQIRQELTKLNYAMDFSSQNCLTSQQVKEITMLFQTETNKLDFARNAYCNTIDKYNFYEVYDAFTSFSAAFKLHDFVLEEEALIRQSEIVERPRPRHQFPSYNYPAWQNYKDNTRCKYPASDEVFDNYVNDILNQYGDRERSAKALQIIQNQCLSVEQIMKIGSLLEAEQNRLQYLKDVYPYTYDYNNYGNCSQLLTKQEYQNDFKVYISHDQNRGPVNPHDQNRVNPPAYRSCVVTQEDMNNIIKSVDEQAFTSSKVTVAKQIVEAKKCFTSQQIKTIVDLLSFENSKLELAEFCYDYCIDKDNYYVINSSFDMSSSVEGLNSYIKGKR